MYKEKRRKKRKGDLTREGDTEIERKGFYHSGPKLSVSAVIFFLPSQR